MIRNLKCFKIFLPHLTPTPLLEERGKKDIVDLDDSIDVLPPLSNSPLTPLPAEAGQALKARGKKDIVVTDDSIEVLSPLLEERGWGEVERGWGEVLQSSLCQSEIVVLINNY
jgi:hypothetical protein